MSTRPKKLRHLLFMMLLVVVAFLLLTPTKVPSMQDGPFAETSARQRSI